MSEEYQYIQQEDLPQVSVEGLATERKGGYNPAQVEAAFTQLRDFGKATASRYNQIVKNHSDLLDASSEKDQHIADLEDKLDKATASAGDASALKEEVDRLKQERDELQAAFASDRAELEAGIAAEREQMQAAFAEAVQAEAARLASSVENEKTKAVDVVEAITEEATRFVSATIDRINAVEVEAREEAEATKQAARDEADRVLGDAKDEATAIVRDARTEANTALEARNRAVDETREIWSRLGMFASAQSQEAKTNVDTLATSDLYELDAPLSSQAIEAGSGEEEEKA